MNNLSYHKIVEEYYDKTEYSMDTDDKNVREERWNKVAEEVFAQFGEEYPEVTAQWEEITYRIQKKVVKEWLLQGKRVDGRAMNQIRPLAAEVGLIPRVHGSGLFTRGQTQVLSICTLTDMCARAATGWNRACRSSSCSETSATTTKTPSSWWCPPPGC